jgi:hypothetical protein
MGAAEGGYLQVLSGRAQTGVRGIGDVRERGAGRAPRGAAVGSRERLPVGRGYVLVCCAGWPPRGAAVVARERLPVG